MKWENHYRYIRVISETPGSEPIKLTIGGGETSVEKMFKFLNLL
jgi:hypothetical protein